MRRKDRLINRLIKGHEEPYEGDEGRRKARDIALLMAGLSIGASVALLLAPSSGEEVRHALGRRYRKTIKAIGRHSEDLRERAEELLERAHELRERGAHLLHFGPTETTRRRA